MENIQVASVPRVLWTKRPAGSKRVHDEFSLSSSAAELKGRERSLQLTPHHLILRPVAKELAASAGNDALASTSTNTSSGADDEEWLAHTALASVVRLPASATTGPAPHTLVLRTRSFDVHTLSFARSDTAEGVWESLRALCTGVAMGGMEGLYPFCFAPSTSKGSGRAGWGIYDPEREFARMGLGSRSHAWRTSSINKDYQFCPTYPAEIIVPARISDSTLGYAVRYRSKGRLPGLVYLHHANLGSITRASQPMVGLKNARSIQDEKLIEAIFASHAQHHHPAAQDEQIYGAMAGNLIIDARPTTNAMANSVKGAGTENMDYYRNCKKAYLGIDNIHVVRNSLAGVCDALEAAETTGHLDRNALRRSGWLRHITSILDGALLIVRAVHLANSHVLVHCSDGWDRTSQLSALAQLCLDPFYRTAEGFAVLIEKDWVSYGHRFSDRLGHLCGDKTQFVAKLGDNTSAQAAFFQSVQTRLAGSSHAFKETCPVFHQFLDCCWQLMRQFPTRFEFNEELLLRLFHESYEGRYGTFLCNSEADRERLRARERTRSIWEDIFDDDLKLRSEYRNSQYDASLDDASSRADDADQGVLFVDAKDARWWYRLFQCDDDDMNGRVVARAEGEDEPVTFIGGSSDDPVIASLARGAQTLSIGGMAFGRQPSPANSPDERSASPTKQRANLPNQAQLAGALSSAQKFGWSAWGKVQKLGQEAVAQYRESQETKDVFDAEAENDTERPLPSLQAPSSENPWAQHSVRAASPPPPAPPAKRSEHPGQLRLEPSEEAKTSADPLGVL